MKRLRQSAVPGEGAAGRLVVLGRLLLAREGYCWWRGVIVGGELLLGPVECFWWRRDFIWDSGVSLCYWRYWRCYCWKLLGVIFLTAGGKVLSRVTVTVVVTVRVGDLNFYAMSVVVYDCDY